MPAKPIILPATLSDDDVIDVEASPLAEGDIDIAGALTGAAPFAGLSDPVIAAIAENAIGRRYGAGQTVYSAGQYDGADAFVVAAGKMRVSVVDAGSGSVMVDDIEPGGCFAIDLTFIGNDNSVFSRLSVTAEEDLTVIMIDAEALRTLAGQRPSLMRNVANYFAGELSVRRFNADVAEVAPQQRVFAELLKYIERDDVSGIWRVPKMPKHRELAVLAGVEESVAAGAVAALIQEGVAQRDYPGLVVNDMARLNQLAG